jgi:hypothetical protein
MLELIRVYRSFVTEKPLCLDCSAKEGPKMVMITNPGVLKMLAMGSDEANLMDYFKK